MVDVAGAERLDALKSSVKRLGIAGVLGIVAIVFCIRPTARPAERARCRAAQVRFKTGIVEKSTGRGSTSSVPVMTMQ
jgi:hypothetical protein